MGALLKLNDNKCKVLSTMQGTWYLMNITLYSWTSSNSISVSVSISFSCHLFKRKRYISLPILWNLSLSLLFYFLYPLNPLKKKIKRKWQFLMYQLFKITKLDEFLLKCNFLWKKIPTIVLVKEEREWTNLFL